MCTPSIPKDNSAQLAQQQNDARQANIRAGQGSIDTAFAGFDDDYYKKYGQAYLDNYNPQVDDQYHRAQQQERYGFARNGTLDSSPAIGAADRLNQEYAAQRQAIASRALGAADTLKNNVTNQKSQLYALNTSAADPALATQQANAAAGTITSTPQASPLGDLFGGLLNSASAYMAGQNKALPAGYASAFAPGATLPGGNGSGRVVG